MSSILEALRELENSQPRATERVTTPVEAPSPALRGFETFIPVTGGLAVGALVFALVVWAPGLLGFSRRDDAPGAAVQTDAAAPERPAWLDTADPPRAQVDPAATGADRLGQAAIRRPAAVPTDGPTESKRSAPTRQLDVESIAFSANPTARTATLRLNGRRVTLRQRESAEGIEVQLIMPDGVYVQRGSEVFLLTPER